MNLEKVKYILLFFLISFVSTQGISQTSKEVEENEILKESIQILKRYFYEQNEWYITKPSVAKNVKGLIDFVEDEPIDTIIGNLNNGFGENENYVFRLPENVHDSLDVPGYFSSPLVVKRLEKISLNLQQEFQNKRFDIPDELITDLDEKLDLIPEGKGIQLFIDSIFTMPDSLQIPELIPDSVLNTPESFNKLVRIDSIRTEFVEQKRLMYNDMIVSSYIDSVRIEIRKQKFEEELTYRRKRLNDSVKVNNYKVLRVYNEQVVNAVNDSILLVLQTLLEYADHIDSTHISMTNLTGGSIDILLQNGNERYARLWLKNRQNDSLSVLVKSTDKKSVQMIIDDGVTFSRYKTKESKEFDFDLLEKNISSLNKVGKRYEIETPWYIGGDGNIGFSQTYLENWKKGGESAISSLIVLQGFANYKRPDGKIKWENTGEFRNGLIRPGGKGAQIQKNDDKFEFTSRYGISAFKKWFYSAEFNFETQLFNGYNYPTSENPDPISAFMAPARSFFKFGLEYKPNKDFSLLLSPITIKNVYVRDTALIDQTKFGIDPNRKSFWEPGLNADLKFKTKITEDISYETKYKMFINYKEPFQKFDINWESLFVMRLSEYVNMRLLVHFIYDDDVLFPVYDENDVKVGEKSKLQVREYFSIGFAYKINRKVMRSKRIR